MPPRRRSATWTPTPSTTWATRWASPTRASSASRPSTRSSRSSRRASTPASCAPAPPATSTAPRTSWPRSIGSLGVKPKQTTRDGKVSLLTARCLGACSLAPAVIVDGETRGKANGADLVAQLEAMAMTAELPAAARPPRRRPDRARRRRSRARLRLRVRGRQLRVRPGEGDHRPPGRVGHRGRPDRRRHQARRLPRPVRGRSARGDPRDRPAVQQGHPRHRRTDRACAQDHQAGRHRARNRAPSSRSSYASRPRTSAAWTPRASTTTSPAAGTRRSPRSFRR